MVQKTRFRWGYYNNSKLEVSKNTLLHHWVIWLFDKYSNNVKVVCTYTVHNATIL